MTISQLITCSKIRENLCIVDISSTTNLPRLVNIVKECPVPWYSYAALNEYQVHMTTHNGVEDFIKAHLILALKTWNLWESLKIERIKLIILYQLFWKLTWYCGLIFFICKFFINKVSQAKILSAEKIPTCINLALGK